MIKSVITAGGKGTRLLPMTKELPKEMMPIFAKISKKQIAIPLLQYIFEQQFSLGIRDYCFIVNRKKPSIENHFDLNQNLLGELDIKSKKIMKTFYEKMNKSNFTWIKQDKPLGFGHAVRLSEKYVGKDDFIVHAGDVAIIGEEPSPITRMIKIKKKFPDVNAILICKKVKDYKRYGVPEIKKIENGVFEVKSVEEKPKHPKSNFGILPIYYFKSDIFDCLKKIKKGKNEEYQLTDAIQKLIDEKKKVLSIEIKNHEIEIDVGNVESYLESLKLSATKARIN